MTLRGRPDVSQETSDTAASGQRHDTAELRADERAERDRVDRVRDGTAVALPDERRPLLPLRGLAGISDHRLGHVSAPRRDRSRLDSVRDGDQISVARRQRGATG